MTEDEALKRLRVRARWHGILTAAAFLLIGAGIYMLWGLSWVLFVVGCLLWLDLNLDKLLARRKAPPGPTEEQP